MTADPVEPVRAKAGAAEFPLMPINTYKEPCSMKSDEIIIPCCNTKRAFLKAGVAGGIMLTAGCASVAPRGQSAAPLPAAAPTKGPLVWLDMDQKELDAAYDPNLFAPNRKQVFGRYASNSDDVRSRLGAPQRHAYGPSPIEALDVYTTRKPKAPVLVFIHGGAWRQQLAKNYAFPAEMFVRHGANFVVPDFAWVQDVGDSLLPMAEQVRRAVAWVYRNANRFGGDPNRIYIVGHSSGAHLTAVTLTTDWKKELNLPNNIVKGGMCISGLYDLKAVRLAARSKYIKFTDAMEHVMSPRRHVANLNAPLIAAYSSLDSREFQRQSRELAETAKAAGKAVEVLVAQGYNHVEGLETLANPYGVFGRAALRLMKLA